MKLILCGGGSGEQNHFANKKLNEIIDHSKPLLYIPLAMDESNHSYDSCYEWICGELDQVQLVGIDMVRSFEELTEKDYSKYCALFIGGGNTYKLLKGIKDSGVFEKIEKFINNGGIVIGGSAGAVIFGYDINIISTMDPNDVKLDDTKGFDVMKGISIFPHYTNKKSKLLEEENLDRLNTFTNAIKEFSVVNSNVIAIPEEDAIFVNDDELEVLGNRPFYFFKNGELQEINLKENANIKKLCYNSRQQ